MAGSILRTLNSCLGTALVCALSNMACAADIDSLGGGSGSALSGWSFGYAPYTYHFSDAKKEHDYEPDDEKHKYVWLVNAEKQLDERQVAGFAYFSNSFGQPSQYAYYGWQFRPLSGTPQLFFKITGGVIHGYKYPYHKKIPLNNKNGWGLTAIPALGWNFDEHWGAQLNLLGKSALMFQLNYSIR
ncbi:hypothetical protein ACFIQG_12290 [Comamonas odontotermitis]|uniref:hypothetical protein n=1 Tax=Comamonas odontotermitis TaxID=379895 RepID=UPI00366C93F6